MKMINCYTGKYSYYKKMRYVIYLETDDKIIHENLRNPGEIIDSLRYQRNHLKFDAISVIPLRNKILEIEPIDKRDFERIEKEHSNSLESWLIFFSPNIKEGIPFK